LTLVTIELRIGLTWRWKSRRD